MSKAVIGLGFGDEGKGLTTNYLYLQNPKFRVSRYSGGQQAGHTVYKDDISHVFSNFGSGTLNGAETYWMETCTFDPEAVILEYKDLLLKGCKPKLIVNGDALVTTPYDKLHGMKHYLESGTCGCGVGSTWQREEDNYHLFVKDLLFPSVVQIKLKLIANYYKCTINEKYFLQACKDVLDIITVDNFEYDFNNKWQIYESSQGLLLDKTTGFHPHVTWSNVGLRALPYIHEVYYVTRAYQTRHGNGPMTNENIPHGIIENPTETNITNKYQGSFRRTLLDVDLLQYALACEKPHGNKKLVLTCLDHIGDDLRFTHKGKIIETTSPEDFATKIFELLKIESGFLSYSNKSEELIPF